MIEETEVGLTPSLDRDRNKKRKRKHKELNSETDEIIVKIASDKKKKHEHSDADTNDEASQFSAQQTPELELADNIKNKRKRKKKHHHESNDFSSDSGEMYEEHHKKSGKRKKKKLCTYDSQEEILSTNVIKKKQHQHESEEFCLTKETTRKYEEQREVIPAGKKHKNSDINSNGTCQLMVEEEPEVELLADSVDCDRENKRKRKHKDEELNSGFDEVVASDKKKHKRFDADSNDETCQIKAQQEPGLELGDMIESKNKRKKKHQHKSKNFNSEIYGEHQEEAGKQKETKLRIYDSEIQEEILSARRDDVNNKQHQRESEEYCFTEEKTTQDKEPEEAIAAGLPDMSISSSQEECDMDNSVSQIFTMLQAEENEKGDTSREFNNKQNHTNQEKEDKSVQGKKHSKKKFIQAKIEIKFTPSPSICHTNKKNENVEGFSKESVKSEEATPKRKVWDSSKIVTNKGISQNEHHELEDAQSPTEKEVRKLILTNSENENCESDESQQAKLSKNTEKIKMNLNNVWGSLNKKKSPTKYKLTERAEREFNKEKDSINVKTEDASLNDSSLEELLEKSLNEKRLLDAAISTTGTIHVMMPYEAPVLHHIETKISSIPTTEQKSQIKSLDLVVKTGNYSKAEDEVIKRNWKEFCKLHDLDEDPTFFLKCMGKQRKNSFMSMSDRLKFVRFLAHGLDNRLLSSVYSRFKKLFRKSEKAGRFSKEEDQKIMEYVTNSNSPNPFADLAQILHRDNDAIQKRCVTLSLTDDTVSWDQESIEKFVKRLLKITQLTDIEQLRNRSFSTEEWYKLGKKFKLPITKLRKAWVCSIHPRIFIEESVNTEEIKKKLIDLFYNSGQDDWKTIDWEELAKNFDGFTGARLNKLFKGMVYYHVPNFLQNDFRATILHLKNEIFETTILKPRLIKKINLENICIENTPAADLEINDSSPTNG